MVDAMVEWFVLKVKIVVKVAERYASLLWGMDIETIEKLKKKILFNENLLISLDFDEDDVEDIMNILLPDHLHRNDRMTKSGPKIPRKYCESEVQNCSQIFYRIDIIYIVRYVMYYACKVCLCV